MPKAVRNALSAAAVTMALASGAAFALPASAQVCNYNSTQSSCACPTSGPGVSCLGGQLYNATAPNCRADSRPCASNQQYNCATTACQCNTTSFPCGGCTAASSTQGASCNGTGGCPTGGVFTNQCSAVGCPGGQSVCNGACMVVNNCSAGLVWDATSCSCIGYVRISPSTPQGGYIQVTSASAPASPSAGMMYYDSGLNKFRCFQGSPASWIDCSSSGAGGTLAGGNAGSVAVWNSATSLTYDSFFNWDSSLHQLTVGASPSTAAVPPYAFSGAADTGLFSPAAGVLGFSAAGAERMRIDNTGKVAIGLTSPGYPLDIRQTSTSASDTAIVRLDNNSNTRLWTGLQLSRGSVAGSEKWFVGMGSVDNSLLFRFNGSTNVMYLDPGNNKLALGNELVTSTFQFSGSTPGFGKVLTSDASGNASWAAPSVGNACNSTRKYVGATPSAYDGNRGGYFATDALCNAAFAGSKVCSAEELLNSYKCMVGGDALSTATGSLWVSAGPPGFTTFSNDCDGWTSNAASGGYFGRLWTLDAATGGKATVATCENALKYACCR